MLKYEVISNQQISPTSILLTLKPKNRAKQLAFVPGQYAAIQFSAGGRPSTVRCFSIVSSPQEAGRLQFAMRVSGDFTYTASTLAVGTTVGVRGPFGSFTQPPAGQKSVLLFAGGIGVTPFISMIRDADSRKLRKYITLVYSCQTQDDVPFAEELIRHTQNNPNFSVIFAIGKGPVNRFAGQQVVQGMITPEILDQMMQSNYSGYDCYICGPKKYMNVIKQAFIKGGAYAEDIHTEEFGVASKSFQGWRQSLPARIYLGTAMSLSLATIAVMGMDLKTTIAKAASVATQALPAQPVTAPPAAASSSDSIAQQSSDSQASTSSGTTNSSSSYSAPASSTNSGTSTSSGSSSSASVPTQNQSYQQPVSSVS